jgi:hypothetical protein
MSFAPILSCSDGSFARVNPDFVVAVEPESWKEPPASLRPRACKVSLVDGEQLDVPGAADEVQRKLGLICVRLALYPSGTPVFLNPSLVLAVEDQSGGAPLVTRSLVMVVMGGFKSSAGNDLTSTFMVRETAQQIMEAVLVANKAHAEGLGRALDSRGPSSAAPSSRIFGPSIECPRTIDENGRRSISSPLAKAKSGQLPV